MFKQFSLTIFLNLLVLCFSQSMFSPNRFDLLVDTITFPIKNYVQGFKSELERNIKFYTNLSLPEEENDNPRPLTVQRANKTSILKKIFETEAPVYEGEEYHLSKSHSGSERLLALTCLNQGVVVSANRTRYFYGGNQLSYEDAHSLIKGTPIWFLGYIYLDNIKQTTAVVDVIQACYCPYDFLGNQCEFQMPFTCEFEQEIPECDWVDPFTYSFNFTGDPPCMRVRKGGAFYFNAKANCRINTQIAEFGYEGVKRDREFAVGAKPSSTVFTYIVNTDTVKISKNPVGVQFSLQFQSFYSLTTHKAFNMNLTAKQLGKIDPIFMIIQLDSSLDPFYTVGTYYYEMYVTNLVYSLSGVDKDFHYTLTDYAYREPPFVKKVNMALVIFLLVLAGLFVFAGWWHYRKYKIEQKDLADKAFYENQNLVDDDLVERPE